MDSGPSIHLTNNLKDFCDFETLEKGTMSTIIANGDIMHLTSVGTVIVEHVLMTDKPRAVKTCLHPVYYSPNGD